MRQSCVCRESRDQKREKSAKTRLSVRDERTRCAKKGEKTTNHIQHASVDADAQEFDPISTDACVLDRLVTVEDDEER